jgi:peptidoglycan DL-endopeptidase CwlO
MRMRRTGRSYFARLLAAMLLLAALASPGSLAWAAPSKQDLAEAKAKLAELSRRLDLLVEQYNQASVTLERSQARLTTLRTISARAEATADAAQQALTDRVVQSYKNSGSGVAVLLGAQSLADFADRLTFLSDLVQRDSDAASLAARTRAEAVRAAAEVSKTIALREAMLDELEQKKASIEASIPQQQALIVQIAGSLAKAEAAAKAEERRQARARAAASVSTTSTSSPDPIQQSSPSPTPSSPPPAPAPAPTSGGGGSDGGSSGPSSAALTAVRAAYSVLGVPYLWGGSSPSSGFDCSGLTMWSWAHAGVSLPHSSWMQYQVIPHVSRSQLVPGDLLFFYSPISHVAIYVGNDMMIHAPHTGSVVSLRQFSTYPDFVGAGRPG